MNEITTENLTSNFKAVIDDVEQLLKTKCNRTGERIADLRQQEKVSMNGEKR